MYVEVGNAVRNDAQVFQTRLLASFAKRGRNRIFTRLEVTSHLEPSIQSAVMMQEQPSLGIEDEAARGDVARHKLGSRVPRGGGGGGPQKTFPGRGRGGPRGFVGGNPPEREKKNSTPGTAHAIHSGKDQ